MVCRFTDLCLALALAAAPCASFAWEPPADAEWHDPRPKGEWHRTIKDTIGCYDAGLYAGGQIVGHNQGCIEIPAGRVFFLPPIHYLHDDTYDDYPPLHFPRTTISNGVASMTMPSAAFDKTPLHCKSRQVLLHQEVSCSD